MLHNDWTEFCVALTSQSELLEVTCADCFANPIKSPQNPSCS
uniref:Uncharacterized protein n=1 Tax=Anguilla anguilla TaxID=7936 RepID=A0A0E9QIC8_ANGAN